MAYRGVTPSDDAGARLEQAHIQPSQSVLESLARVLRLDDDQRAYLYELAAKRHHVGRRYGRLHAIAYHPGGRRAEGRQGGHGTFRPDLLDDAGHGVHRDDERDHRGVGQVSVARVSTAATSKPRSAVAQLLQHTTPHRSAPLPGDDIGPVLLQPPRRLLPRQTRGEALGGARGRHAFIVWPMFPDRIRRPPDRATGAEADRFRRQN